MLWPFSKPIWELEEGDLSDLKGKQEAFTFDYKGAEFIEHPKDIAKHIASFANHHGGWLFIGVSGDKATNEPHLPPEGVPRDKAHTETVYSAAMNNLSPAPLVVVRLVELEGGNSVLAVQIEESQDTPHIHKPTGRIFVRNGNVTDWVDYVRDRHELERLYERSERSQSAVEQLVARREFGYALLKQLRERAGDTSPCGGCAVVFPFAADPDLLSGLNGDLSSWRTEPFAKSMSDQFARAERHDWQHGVTLTGRNAMWDEKGRALAVTSYGHVEVAWLSHSVLGAKPFIKEHFREVLRFAQSLLRKSGYLGRVGVAVSFADADRVRAIARRTASVADCQALDLEGLGDELLRGAQHPDDWGEPPAAPA